MLKIGGNTTVRLTAYPSIILYTFTVTYDRYRTVTTANCESEMFLMCVAIGGEMIQMAKFPKSDNGVE